MNEANQNPETPVTGEPQVNKNEGKGCLVLTILIIVLLVGAGVLFYLKIGMGYNFANIWDSFSEKEQNATSVRVNSVPEEYQKFVGSWDTGCLVPNLRDAYAEKHEFKFLSDGTATHWRWMGESCSTLTKESPEEYKISLKEGGKVDFIDRPSGSTVIFDIFSFENDSLFFGHGFNNGMSSSTNSGGSEGDRFNGLNKFLAYKKVN